MRDSSAAAREDAVEFIIFGESGRWLLLLLSCLDRCCRFGASRGVVAGVVAGVVVVVVVLVGFGGFLVTIVVVIILGLLVAVAAAATPAAEAGLRLDSTESAGRGGLDLREVCRRTDDGSENGVDVGVGDGNGEGIGDGIGDRNGEG